jgi:hypothetical protein
MSACAKFIVMFDNETVYLAGAVENKVCELVFVPYPLAEARAPIDVNGGDIVATKVPLPLCENWPDASSPSPAPAE